MPPVLSNVRFTNSSLRILLSSLSRSKEIPEKQSIGITSGWESHSLKYTGRYTDGMENLALDTATGDALTNCSEEKHAVTFSMPRNPSNKVVTTCKTEIKAILVAAFYKLTKMPHLQNYPFPPQTADVAATGFQLSSNTKSILWGLRIFPSNVNVGNKFISKEKLAFQLLKSNTISKIHFKHSSYLAHNTHSPILYVEGS